MTTFGVIGRGSYGYVLKNQGLALKVSSTDDESHGRDMVHELWVLSFLGSHSSIVDVKGIWRTPRCRDVEVGIVMELCSRPLSEAIGECAIIEDDLFDLTKQLTSGVAYMASKGIVHCDLSTGNVLIDQLGNLKITDFGMARVLTTTQPRTLFDSLITNETVRAPELLQYNLISPKFNKGAFQAASFLPLDMKSMYGLSDASFTRCGKELKFQVTFL
jgi:serine/threonine protein kinase